MKKFTKLIASVIVLTMALTACNTSGTKTSTTSASNENQTAQETQDEGGTKAASGIQYPADTETIELRMNWWGSETRHEALETVIELYKGQHPNVTIKAEYGAWDGWTQKILTQLSGKSEPDIMQVNYNWVHSFGKGKNVFYNLNDLSEFIDLTNWDQTQLDALTVGGELGAIPHGINGRAYLYNKVLFEEAGLEYPATYDDMIAAAAIIGKDNTPTGADNKYVLTNIGKESKDLYIAQMLYNKTGKLMQENGKVNYSVEEVTEVFDRYKELETSGAIPTFTQDDPLQNESNPVWTSGKSGSCYEWIGTMDKYLGSYKGGEAKDEIGVAPYITEKADDKIKVFVKPSLGYAISKNTQNPAVAADFINFMFTDEEAVKTIGSSLGVSSHKFAREVQDKEGIVQGAMKEGFELLANYEQVVMDPYFEDENVRAERYNAIEAFRSGKDSSADAAKAYIEKQQAQLDKLYK